MAAPVFASVVVGETRVECSIAPGGRAARANKLSDGLQIQFSSASVAQSEVNDHVCVRFVVDEFQRVRVVDIFVVWTECSEGDSDTTVGVRQGGVLTVVVLKPVCCSVSTEGVVFATRVICVPVIGCSGRFELGVVAVVNPDVVADRSRLNGEVDDSHGV